MGKLERDEITSQLAGLQAILDGLAPSSFLARTGLEARKTELFSRLKRLEQLKENSASVALYFGGAPVIGSAGIRADFAADAIGAFQNLLAKVWTMAEIGQMAPTGPIRDREASQLHITSLVHGSFGFLLEEVDPNGDALFATPLRNAANEVTNLIESFAGESDDKFSETIEHLTPRVFYSACDFLRHIHRDRATFRLVEGTHDYAFDRSAIERAWNRVQESDVEEEQITVRGELLGVIPYRHRFEFLPDGQSSIIEGKVGDEFSERYLERIRNEQLAGRRWRALVYKRRVTKPGRRRSEFFTLLKLDELDSTADTE